MGERELDGSHFQQLIAPFFARVESARDYYFTIKWAEGSDGRVAGRNYARVQISNDESARIVHQLRARSTAIVVGINTVLNDDPELSVRGIDVSRQPTRIVLDRELRIPNHAKLIQTIAQRIGGHVLVFCSSATHRQSPRVAELESLGVQVGEVVEGERDLLSSLELMMIQRDEIDRNPHILIEAGPTLARATLPYADRLWIFRSPKRIGGGPSAPRSTEIPTHYVATGTLDLVGDTLTEYLNTASPAFFAAVPSADFVLAQESASLP